jgi:hypothetical protein
MSGRGSCPCLLLAAALCRANRYTAVGMVGLSVQITCDSTREAVIPTRPSVSPPRVLKKTSLSLPEDLWKRLRIQAINEDRDAQDLLAEAIAAYLDGRCPRPAR